ncbi:hypothetical protein FQN55_007689 [Onygenales sp. PD_40]|nr:hypothetical protein FQN55_007689 [Onygenales sp. PD_40]
MERTNLDASIDMCRGQIAAGCDVEGYQAYLDDLLEAKAEIEVDYAEGEPLGLSKDVYQRIWCLKQPVEYDELIPISSKINTDAILEAYRAGKLEIQPGMVSVWVDGKQITPLMPEDWDKLCPLWEQYKGHAIWLETGEGVLPCFAPFSIPASNLQTTQNNV